MQILCMASEDDQADVVCPVCEKKYAVYFARHHESRRAEAVASATDALREQHSSDRSAEAHPEPMFNVPSWSGPAHMSGAALLSGAPVRMASVAAPERLVS